MNQNEIKKLEIYDMAFIEFLKNDIQIAEPEREVSTRLKKFYNAYKKRAILTNIQPMKYKIFRKAITFYFTFTKSSFAQIEQKNNTWLIKNAYLVNKKKDITELYKNFYNLEML